MAGRFGREEASITGKGEEGHFVYSRTLLVHPSPQEICLNDIKISILKSLFRAKYDLYQDLIIDYYLKVTRIYPQSSVVTSLEYM